jgi:hypothetical protein
MIKGGWNSWVELGRIQHDQWKAQQNLKKQGKGNYSCFEDSYVDLNRGNSNNNNNNFINTNQSRY